MGLYVYAVGSSAEGAPPPLQGVFDRPLYRIDAGALCAIVSECAAATLRAERRHMMAAQRALSALNQQLDVLPMAFGTIAKSEADVRRFIDERREVLTAQLRRVSGAVEMSLRLSLDAPDPVAYLVERTPTLRAARERIFNGRRVPSHDEKVRLGQLFNDVLLQYREARAAEVTAVVGDACVEIVQLPVRAEKEIANFAALTPRSGLELFEAAVQRAAERCDEDIAFNVSGPWPPYNFAQSVSRED